jgi:hypothetical protein
VAELWHACCFAAMDRRPGSQTPDTGLRAWCGAKQHNYASFRQEVIVQHLVWCACCAACGTACVRHRQNVMACLADDQPQHSHLTISDHTLM